MHKSTAVQGQVSIDQCRPSSTWSLCRAVHVDMKLVFCVPRSSAMQIVCMVRLPATHGHTISIVNFIGGGRGFGSSPRIKAKVDMQQVAGCP